MTLMIQRGQLVITTFDAAESHQAMRIYDVSPLIEEQKRTLPKHDDQPFSPAGYGSPPPDADGLMEVIQALVAPDTWESLGGPSTMAVRMQGERVLLVIATLSEVHWQVQELLNRLNMNGGVPSQQ
ncbi:MAG: hypothetical protein R3C05_26820 [Pirellulaceae bacterium]